MKNANLYIKHLIASIIFSMMINFEVFSNDEDLSSFTYDQSITPDDLSYVKNSIREIPNFPKEGINFFDITTLIANPKALNICMTNLEEHYRGKEIDAIVCLESRGFIFGSILADRLKLPVVLVRKQGKLPADKFQVRYEKEYGFDIFELHRDSIIEGARVVIVDDLIATGGTANAAIDLIQLAKGNVIEVAAIIEIKELNGRDKIKAQVYTIL